MKSITIALVQHQHQRYPTVGDWIDTDGHLRISVSQMADWRYVVLVGVHELVEAVLCRHRGISEEAVTAFDKHFEATRDDGNDAEPGDHPAAPYRQEHFFATSIERLLAQQLGVDWAEYEAAINAL